jgi:hypothetical protein
MYEMAVFDPKQKPCCEEGCRWWSYSRGAKRVPPPESLFELK